MKLIAYVLNALLVLTLTRVVIADETAPAKTDAPAAPAAPTADASTAKKAEPTFTGEAADLKKHMEGLFEYSKKVNAAQPAEKSEARAKIEAAVDWEKIAKDCIGPGQLKKQSAQNVTEFKKLLKEVILKTAFSRMDKFWDGAVYKFETIKVTGPTADSVVKFNVKGEWVALGYSFRKNGSSWKIYDIAYEDLHYSKNINEQIEAFLKDQSFANLLTKLRKRRDELDSPKKKSS